MEEKYGCLRMVVLWLFSSLGGEPSLMTLHHVCTGLPSSKAILSQRGMSCQHCAEQCGSCTAFVVQLPWHCNCMCGCNLRASQAAVMPDLELP